MALSSTNFQQFVCRRKRFRHRRSGTASITSLVSVTLMLVSSQPSNAESRYNYGKQSYDSLGVTTTNNKNISLSTAQTTTHEAHRTSRPTRTKYDECPTLCIVTVSSDQLRWLPTWRYGLQINVFVLVSDYDEPPNSVLKTCCLSAKNEMSQYRAYFVPDGTDPEGLQGGKKEYYTKVCKGVKKKFRKGRGVFYSCCDTGWVKGSCPIPSVTTVIGTLPGQVVINCKCRCSTGRSSRSKVIQTVTTNSPNASCRTACASMGKRGNGGSSARPCYFADGNWWPDGTSEPENPLEGWECLKNCSRSACEASCGSDNDYCVAGVAAACFLTGGPASPVFWECQGKGQIACFAGLAGCRLGCRRCRNP